MTLALTQCSGNLHERPQSNIFYPMDRLPSTNSLLNPLELLPSTQITSAISGEQSKLLVSHANYALIILLNLSLPEHLWAKLNEKGIPLKNDYLYRKM